MGKSKAELLTSTAVLRLIPSTCKAAHRALGCFVGAPSSIQQGRFRATQVSAWLAVVLAERRS